MQLSDFHFELPAELIAKYPVEKRSASRLMHIAKTSADLLHKSFADIIDIVQSGDLLVFNDTRVIPARLTGYKNTGGRVEILVERILDAETMLAQVKASKTLQVGSYVTLPSTRHCRVAKNAPRNDDVPATDEIILQVIDRDQQFYKLRYINGTTTILQMIEALGEIPLPPYMHRKAEASDLHRYQTVYAKHKGSVAAPTAGFHFDDELLQQLKAKNVEMGYLTLHIGAGTFAPVRVDAIQDHKMHAEYLEVSEELCEKIRATKARGNRVIAVGTTSLRALETASQSGNITPYRDETRIFIYPGYEFQCADALITNLHLPSSTLLMLVCAFAGFDKVMHAYRTAVANAYRFYSYGDAMWMECTKNTV